MKRIFDLVASAMGIILLSPLMCIIAVAIVATEGRPVVFKQKRVGLKGRPFDILKFRTMAQPRGNDQTQFHAGDSSRVTVVGRFLRKTKLDEFPQLFNVFVGEMSVVGPRPEVPMWVEKYPERWRVVHQVRPGITDPASIEFRNEEDILVQSSDPQKTYAEVVLPRKLDLYEKYIQERSMAVDFKIVLNTFLELRK